MRLNEPVPLFKDDPQKSSAMPVCLPWSENDPGTNLEKLEEEEKKTILTGWGKISVRIADTIRKKKFGVSVPVLRRVALPIANKICKDDPEETKKKRTIRTIGCFPSKSKGFPMTNYFIMQSIL